MIHNPSTVEEFNNLITNDLVLLDFWGTWCGPCLALAPVLDQLSKTIPNLTIVKINVDSLQELAVKYKVRGIPYLVWIKKGQIAKTHSGMTSADNLVYITQTLA